MDQNKDTLVSSEEEAQIQLVLEQIHQIATELSHSTDSSQVEAALRPVNNLSETAQMSLLRSLSKTRETDAADTLLAINEFSSIKNVRKEARRALIRLESTKIYPRWKAPVGQAPVSLPETPNVQPRFWKGVVTQAREGGEAQLILAWEMGSDYNDVRALIFLLDFWQEGIKDFTIDTTTKRQFNTRLAEILVQSQGISTTDCTLAEGQRLIKEALSINQWRGTPPHKAYRVNTSMVNQLILSVTEPGEDRGRTFIDPSLEPEEVVLNFIGAWALGDYGLAYDLLSNTSELRDGLSRDEWIERRRAWADEAHPARLELGFAKEREAKQSAIWVPNSLARKNVANSQEVEVGWSLELTDTQLSGTLKEIAMGTTVNRLTGRHWFWTSYKLNQDGNEWRIQSMTDEGASAQGLSLSELQKQINEHDDRINEILQNPKPGASREEANKLFEELVWRVTQAMYYDDALMVKSPLDRTVFENAYNHAKGIGANERMVVYLEKMAKNFVEYRAGTLRELALTLATLADQYEEQQLKERAEETIKMAEEKLREAITVDEAAMGYVLLSELLIRNDNGDEDRLKEAETLLQKAQTLSPERVEQTLIEVGFGNIALSKEDVDLAVQHYQKAAEISPDYPGIWYNIGHLQLTQNKVAEAEQNLRRSLEEAPNDMRAFTELGSIYLQRNEYRKAREVLEQGVRSNPQSAELRALIASVYLEEGDKRHAQDWLEEAVRLNPNSDIVRAVRQSFNQAKKK